MAIKYKVSDVKKATNEELVDFVELIITEETKEANMRGVTKDTTISKQRVMDELLNRLGCCSYENIELLNFKFDDKCKDEKIKSMLKDLFASREEVIRDYRGYNRLNKGTKTVDDYIAYLQNKTDESLLLSDSDIECVQSILEYMVYAKGVEDKEGELKTYHEYVVHIRETENRFLPFVEDYELDILASELMRDGVKPTKLSDIETKAIASFLGYTVSTITIRDAHREEDLKYYRDFIEMVNKRGFNEECYSLEDIQTLRSKWVRLHKKGVR